MTDLSSSLLKRKHPSSPLLSIPSISPSIPLSTPCPNPSVSLSQSRILSCNSPSHFKLSGDEYADREPVWLKVLPERVAVNDVLQAVASVYYLKKEEEGGDGKDKEKRKEGMGMEGKSGVAERLTTLDRLLSSLRKPSVFGMRVDVWSGNRR